MLITGGCRSGKSDYALRLAEGFDGPRYFVATCPRIDGEMNERIERHQRQRDAAMWRTVEEPFDLAGALALCDKATVALVDCVTLWVNNLMYEASQSGREFAEDEITERIEGVFSVCGRLEGDVIFVTNEVGLGIVPDNEQARRYRDLVGRCNQRIAAVAGTVVLMSCGLPLILKGEVNEQI